jgi:hypothetical protein
MSINIKTLIAPLEQATTTSNDTNQTGAGRTNPTTGNVVNDEDLETKDNNKAGWLNGLVVGIKENSNYAIAIGALIGILLIYFVVSSFVKRKNANLDKGKTKPEETKVAAKKEKIDSKAKEELDKILDEMESKKK